MMNQASPMAEQPMNLVSQEQQQACQKLTIEQEEERKLKMKYPNPQKPGGSAFIQKMLHKGSKKYFDSGDYNMAKSKKQGLLNGLGKSQVPSQQPPINGNVSSTPISRQTLTETPTNDHTMSFTNNNNDSINTNSPMPNSINNSSNYNESPSSSSVLLSSTGSSTQILNTNNNNNMSTPEIKIVNAHESVKFNCTPNHKSGLATDLVNVCSSSSNSTSPLMSASVSTTNFKNASQSGNILSSSMSCDKIAQIQINNQQEEGLQLDSEDIGHTIPTPECLPQSRKHSIVQSKLATTQTVHTE